MYNPIKFIVFRIWIAECISESNPAVLLGKPVIKETRLTVEFILQKLSEGATAEQLTTAYPSLKSEDILAVLVYAPDIISNEIITAAA